MEYYSPIKKRKIMPFAATWLQLEILILSEVSQKENDKYHTVSLISGIQCMAQWTYLHKRNELMFLENRLWLSGGGGGSGMDWDFRVSRCKLLHLEWVSNEILLYSTRNYTQSLVIEHDGGQSKKKHVFLLYSRNWQNIVNQL